MTKIPYFMLEKVRYFLYIHPEEIMQNDIYTTTYCDMG